MIMKAQICRHFSSATLVALIVATMPLRAADDPRPAGADVPKIAVAPTNAPTAAVAPATGAESAQGFQMPKLGLPPVLDQVVKLSQAGTGETVIRAYIEQAAPAYRITGNEIVQLRDLGISQNVIMSLIDHSQSAAPSSVTEVTGPQISSAAQTNTSPSTNAQIAAAPPETAADFYDSLAPYGTWTDVPGYGWCWQPTVVVVNSDWRPYCDGGYWLWSDAGWYWHSYYSWGWAPFHYGRWFCHGNRGWLWCPDRVWGPAWVCWRNSATHCGWAPLPPGACFTAGLGWTWHGAHVGIDFGFGLAAAHFTFVGHDHFSDRHVGGHSLRGHDAIAAYNNTTVLNNYAMGANNRVINHGIARETIAAASRTPIHEVAVRDLPRGNSVSMPDRVSRVGNADVVFRPSAPSSVPRTTVTANQSARGTFVARNAASTSAFSDRVASRLC